MITSVSKYDFHRSFEQCRPANFTYEGLNVLFEYFESLEDDTGEQIELDVIGICCEYSEDTFQDIADNYDIDLSEYEDDDEKMDCVRSYLEDNTTICGETSDSFVYLQF